MKTKTVALIGNPNSGKTTLFNHLSGSNQYVGNWPGVTVEKKEAKLKHEENIKLVDLPGIYSLSPYTMEERIARDYIVLEKPDLLVTLVDATNLERNLYLVSQLLETGVPMILAVNMMDLADKAKIKIDHAAMEKALGVPCCPITAAKGDGVGELIARVKVELGKTEKFQPQHINFSGKLEKELQEISEIINPYVNAWENRYYTLRFFENDTNATRKIGLSNADAALIKQIREKAETEFDDDAESIISGERYDYIAQIMPKFVQKSKIRSTSASDKIDRVVTSRIFGLPIFIAVMFFVYWLTTFAGGPGTIIGDLTNDVFVGEWIQGGVSNLLTGWGVSDFTFGLVVNGMIAGVGAVIGFIPQMFILFVLLSLLEQIGYMARVAFLMDRIFRKVGLSGKSFIPILISSGCAVPGIMATRTIENVKDRRLTIMVASFIPCGAKLPIIALITGALFSNAWWVAPVVYFMCISVIITSGIILKKFKAFAGEVAPFIMEMPPYHVPRLGNMARQVWHRLKAFITKAGTIILASSIIIWALSNLSWSFRMVENPADSMLAGIGRFLSPVFAPLGFGYWQAVIGTISGLVAKENLLASMAVFFPMSADQIDNIVDNSQPLWAHLQNMFTSGAIGGFAFLSFNLLCAPCFAAIGSIAREMGLRKWTWGAIMFQTINAYIVSFLIYQIGGLIVGSLSFSFLSAISLVVLAFMLYLLFRPNTAKKHLESLQR